MFRLGKFQLPIAWVLLCAVVFNIALPAFAAARGGDSLAMVEICTSSGVKKLAATGVDSSSASHVNLLHDGHCQLCPVGGATLPAIEALIALPIALWPTPTWPPAPSIPAGQPDESVPPPPRAPPVPS